MADASSSPPTLESNPQNPGDTNPNLQSNQRDAVPASAPSQPPPPPPPSTLSSFTPVPVNPNSNPTLVSPLPPSMSYTVPPPVSGVPPTAPSFRPFPQFSPLPNAPVLNPSFQNPGVQNPGVQPPGVSSASPMNPGAVSGGLGAVASSVPQPLMAYQVPPGQLPNPALRPTFVPGPNGYTVMPAVPQGTIPPPVS